MLDSKFSSELKDLISDARKIAIDLGCDYISTIHFFLADCESTREDSILTFAFKDETGYQNFKKSCSCKKDYHVDLTNESLPLTKEAEATIKLSKIERKLQKHNLVFPCHLFIAALKNKESLLSKCFEQDENSLVELTKFYGDFDKINHTEIISEKVFQENQQEEKKIDLNFINRLKKILRLIK